MSDVNALLKLALSPERSTAERLRSLDELHDLLHEESVVFQLLDAARAESSIEVRRAMLETVLDVDITRLKNRARHLDGVAYFAGLEPETPLRLLAIGRLADLAPQEAGVEAILADTLAYDLDEDVQRACLEGLARAPRLAAKSVDAILAFAPRAPASMRPALLAAADHLERDAAQRALASLLAPWDPAPLPLLERLAKFPSLAPGTTRAITTYVQAETRSGPRAAAIRILTERKDADPALFEAIFTLVAQFPDRAELVEAFRHGLASYPELVPRLVTLFEQARSTGLKLTLLGLLDEAELDDLWRAALRDASPWVRNAAIRRCARHTQRFAGDLTEAIEREPIAGLREAMVRAFIGAGFLPADVQRFFAAWAARETDPRVEEPLAAALTNIPITEENRAALLRVYRRILTNPFANDDVRAAVTGRVRSFAYRDEPELVECLKALLERETEIERVEELHEQLRRLEPDLDGLAPTLLKLFYRFLHHYPRDPLHQWTQDFRSIAERVESVREQIAYIVKLTGATWMLDRADTQARKTNLLSAVLESIRRGEFHGPQRLLDEAWESRTLRKSDLIALLNRLVECPGQDAVVGHVFKIMQDAKLMSPEILDRCLDALSRPTSITTYEIRRFLENAGRSELGYRDRIVALFNQLNYSRYGLANGGPRDARERPTNWNDWEYQGWRLMHDGWPIAELYFDLKPMEEMRELLASPPDEGIPAVQTVHYLVLYNHYWKNGVEEAEDYRAIGRLMRNVAGVKGMEPLHDRAVCMFTRRWNEFVNTKLRGKRVPADLAQMAAEAYVELCKRHAKFREKEEEKLPEALKGLDLMHLERLWPFGSASWKDAYEHCCTATGEEEEQAEELYRRFATAVNEGRREEALSMLDALLTPYRHTNVVKRRRAQIERERKKLAT